MSIEHSIQAYVCVVLWTKENSSCTALCHNTTTAYLHHRSLYPFDQNTRERNVGMWQHICDSATLLIPKCMFVFECTTQKVILMPYILNHCKVVEASISLAWSAYHKPTYCIILSTVTFYSKCCCCKCEQAERSSNKMLCRCRKKSQHSLLVEHCVRRLLFIIHHFRYIRSRMAKGWMTGK